MTKMKHFLSELLKNITSPKTEVVDPHLFHLFVHLQLSLRKEGSSFL